MGNELDFEVIKTHLKRPKAPAIAFVSQFTFMPLVSFERNILAYTFLLIEAIIA